MLSSQSGPWQASSLDPFDIRPARRQLPLHRLMPLGRGDRPQFTTVSPFAQSPARIKDSEARKSVAITGAPFSDGTPRTMAEVPWER